MAKVQASLLSTAGAKFLGRTYQEMDCQKFVENCLAEIGIKKDQAGSNAWFRFVTWTGTPEECKQKFGSIPKGAFLFILEHDGNEPEKYRNDGIGNASHIGIYTGLSGGEMTSAATKAGVINASDWDYGSGAMHSSSSRGHVCTSKFAGKSISGGWNRVGLWNALSYGDKIDAILQGSGGVGEVTIATVVAESGSTVNMRSRASTSGAVIRRISVGEHVTVNDHGAEWCEIMYQGDNGYMMTKFLSFEEDSNEITVKKDDVKKVYDILGECLKQVIVDKANVETAYDTIGDWLGLRG